MSQVLICFTFTYKCTRLTTTKTDDTFHVISFTQIPEINLLKQFLSDKN